MALRRPLVLINGVVSELPAGDTLPSSGGGSVVNQLILPLTAVAMEIATVTVSVPGVVPSNKIRVDFVPNDSNEAEDIKDDQMRIFAEAGTDQIFFTLLGDGSFVGPFTINYEVAT